MKKLGLMIGAGVLLMVIAIAATGLWVKGHMQYLARRLTGLDISFASMDLHYAPMPLIVLTDLALEQGTNSIRVPRLELYPDLAKVFSGQIVVKKAILEEPLVLTRSPGGDDPRESAAQPSGAAPFSMGAVPDGVMVVERGQVVLQSPRGDRLPLRMTAQAEKADQRLSIQLTSATVDEIGLTFIGEIDIESFAPLKLKIDAAQGSFAPPALKDFLVRFGYLDNAAADRLPAVQRIQAKGLTLAFDAAARDIALTAQRLEADRVALNQLTVKLSRGAFEVACADGEVDAESMFGWLQQSPDLSKVLDDMLARAGLRSMQPTGTVRIAALHLRSAAPGPDAGAAWPPGPMDGAVDLAVQDLILRLVAQNGQEQHLTISRLESRVTIAQGKPSVQVKQLTFASSMGGGGHIQADLPLPPDFQHTTVKSAIDGLKVFDVTLDLHLDREAQAPQTRFDLTLIAPSLELLADGLLFIPGPRQTDLEARLTRLRIARPAPDTRTGPSTAAASLDRPFDAGRIVDQPISARVFVKAFEWGAATRLQDVDLRLTSAHKRAVLHGTVRMCDLDLILDGVVLPPSQVVTTVETRGTDVDLTALVACFSKELPVYLAGRLFLNGSFTADGNTPKALMDGAQGEITLMLTQASVQRLSGLDPRLGFFLDILRSARISSETEDAISFSKAVIKASLQKGRLVVDRFSMIGPLLSAWGSGEFILADKRLKLSGGVRTAMGITRGLDIDRILEKEGT